MSDDVRDISSAPPVNPHRAAAKRRKQQKLAKRELDETFKRIDRAAHQMLENLLQQQMPELTIHSMNGRGFMLHIIIVDGKGMPWKPEPDEAEEPAERLIIMPHEQ